MFTLLFTLLLIVTATEIRAREAIKPEAEVGQIIKDFEEVHVNETNQRGAPCKLDIQDDFPYGKRSQPLYLHPNTDTYWLPNAEGQLVIPRGASIELYCSSAFASINTDDHVTPDLSSIHARCLHDSTFEWTGGKREFQDFYCTQQLAYAVERLEQPCGDGDVASAARMYRVGYNLGAGRFVRTLELCHDAEKLQTEYAFYQLLPANEHFQRHVKRVRFSTAGHFCGFDMERLYSQTHQQQRAVQLLHQAAEATATLGDHMKGLFDKKAGLFLARGHLAAKGDLIYASQQRSSFNYLNVAPQWQSFNGGHWAIVEDETRRFVARSGLSVSVYTGTYGVMPLPDAAQTDFHLATDANNTAVLRVPRLYYRLLIDNDRPWRGLALIGVNNPHATLSQIRESYMICDPLQPELVPWLRWLYLENLVWGYLYACTVADVARVVGHLPPQLQEVHDLLS
ncbi:uncharacterized protein LOC117787921 [Drosophila innubila]|uniref:uncharacterized protein LOC117787921 n=1 Tax=Drosophila innubila TaxID=198719 RepID=UPI00148D7D39|nr:uncharacterized protein LOC117787921 [Drosophila innubila]